MKGSFGILSDSVLDEVIRVANGCRLCWAMSDAGQRFPSNTILFQRNGFTIIPALGAFTQYYVLAVSQSHMGSVAMLDHSSADLLESTVRNLIVEFYQSGLGSDWIVFEHGTTAKYGLKTCCVDHLHLHLVPVTVDLIAELGERMGCEPIPIASFRDIPRHLNGCTNYILARNSDGKQAIITPPAYSSQYVRQLLAAITGRPKMWNWRSTPFEESSVKTLKRFRKARLARSLVYVAHAIENIDSRELGSYLERLMQDLQHHCPDVDFRSMAQMLSPERRQLIGIRDGDLDRFIVETETTFLRSSDAVLVDLSKPDWPYVGALMEIVYAHEWEIPVIAIVGNSQIQNRRWLRAHVDGFAQDTTEAVEHLKRFLQ